MNAEGVLKAMTDVHLNSKLDITVQVRLSHNFCL